MSGKEHKEKLDAAFIISQASKKERKLHEEAQKAAAEAEPSPPENTKDEPRRRKNKVQEYESLFIRNKPLSARKGKNINIRDEFHDRIKLILLIIGNNEVSVFSYLDNVLEHHFDTFEDEIDELYNSRLKLSLKKTTKNLK